MSRLAYCLQIVAENPPTPQQHCQDAVCPLVVENIAKYFQERFFVLMFCRHTASAPITTFSPKRTWGKNKIVIDFDPFL